MREQDSIKQITKITLLANLIGILAMQNELFGVLIIPLLLFPKYKVVSLHKWQHVATFIGTNFIFGIANGQMINQLTLYMQGQTQDFPYFAVFVSMLTVFHYFEFQLVNNFHHSELSWKSYLIYHSIPYTIANVIILIEHFTAVFIGLPYKKTNYLMWPGFVVGVLGETLRIAAFFTCKSNFTHLVRYSKVKGHQLVTNGVYSFFRHPSYTGYFYFVIGGQIFVGNFLSAALSAVTLYRFFKDRIQLQQKGLASFFPQQYPKYKKRTHILIPFLKDPPLPFQYQRESGHQQ